MLSSQGKNAPSNPYPHYLVRFSSLKVLAGHGENMRPTWVIHMATRRPAHNTPIHMNFLYGFLLKGPESMWIGVLWAGLRAAMWITHVGGKFRHGLLEKSLP